MAGRFIAETCLIFLTLTLTPPSGTSRHPQPFPHLLVPLHCTIPGALLLPSPTLPLHAAPHPHATCLPWCLYCLLHRSCKGSFGTLKSQFPQGNIYPTGTRFHIPDFSLISGSPGDRASTRSRGPVTRVTCHGNQDSLRLVPARAVACRA